MSKINRYTGNVRAFGVNSTLAGRTVFGQLTNSDTLDDNVTNEYIDGWEATTDAVTFPTLQDMNAAFFTAGQFLSYLHQEGVPDWDSLQEYYVNSYAKGSDGILYRSKTGVPLTPNVGNNPTLDAINWETSSATSFQNKVLANTGYQVFPGGLIMQWLTVVGIPFGATVNLPITFPNSYLGGLLTDNTIDCQSTGITSAGTSAVMVWSRVAASGAADTTEGKIFVWGY